MQNHISELITIDNFQAKLGNDEDVSVIKFCDTKLPSQISILLNSATPFTTATVMSSGMQKMQFEFSPEPLQVIPEFNVSVVVDSKPLTVKDIFALADLRDLGT